MTPSELKVPKKKPAPIHLVAGSFAVVTVDAFVFGNVSATPGSTAFVEDNFTQQNACQSSTSN